MLVLSRKEGQRIMIGENIEVVVVAVNGNVVQLGFNAPRDVPIHREEIHRRIATQPREAVLCVEAGVVASA